MIWNKEIECASRKDTEELKLEKLKKTIKYVYEKVPFYKERLDSIGVSIDKIKSFKDIEKIPFTTKEDLRINYPYKLFAVPKKDIVRIHASSGTTGKPTVVGYTRKDLEVWSECVARIAVMGGANEDDIAQISFGYGLFTGALGLHSGLEKIGAAIIPISSGNTEKQLMVMKDFETTLLVSTPSYALHMSDIAFEMGIKPGDLKLRIALLGAEGHTEEMNLEIEKRWGVIATENYGLSEIIGPGVSGECTNKTGLHFNEDCFFPEIIDPITGEVLPIGSEGELVITTIDKEGFPLLRYRTRDITSLTDEPCVCGRTSLRMTKVKGRSDDMLVIKGVNVYPSQIESLIIGIDKISPYYQLVLSKKGYNDTLEVQVELIDESILEIYGELEALETKIKNILKNSLGLECKVRLREPNTIERTTGKAKRIIDNR